MYHYAIVHKISMSVSNLAGSQAINQHMQNCIILMSVSNLTGSQAINQHMQKCIILIESHK